MNVEKNYKTITWWWYSLIGAIGSYHNRYDEL